MGKSIKQEIETSKKETKMKTLKLNQTAKTILTIVFTLATVAAFAATFIAGMNYQKNQDDTIKREAISLSEQMATSKQ